MAAKNIAVSTDNGVTWLKLPGSSGERRTELANVNDTVFGQNWQSENPTISQGMISCNAYFKGISGYSITLRETGTPTAMTAEALSLVSGKTYQITANAKRIIDYTNSLNVFDNGVDQTANVQSIDYLTGKVTFKSTYTVNGPVTITGRYVPTVVIAGGRSTTITQQAAEIDQSSYETVQANNGWRTFIQGLRTVSLEVGGFYNPATDEAVKLASRALLVIDISPDASPDTLCRGFFKRMSTGQSGNVGALEEKTVSFTLSVPDGDLVELPFSWYFTQNSKLNPAVRAVIGAWQSGAVIKVRYLGDGVNGVVSDAIVTEATLANTLEGQNEFRFNFRQTGQPSPVP